MAVKGKGGKKSGVAASKPKSKSKVEGPAKTITRNGKRYSHDSCYNSEAGAKSKANKLRESGKLARVVGNCVYTRSK